MRASRAGWAAAACGGCPDARAGGRAGRRLPLRGASDGHGVPRDLARCEDAGAVADADVAQVSDRALDRGLGPGRQPRLGQPLPRGAGRRADLRRDRPPPRSAWPRAGVRDDPLRITRARPPDLLRPRARMLAAMPRYGIQVPDPQLACAPVDSPEGRGYLGAMAAAANYGRANRQLLTQAARSAFQPGPGQRPGPRLRRVAQPGQTGDPRHRR